MHRSIQIVKTTWQISRQVQKWSNLLKLDKILDKTKTTKNTKARRQEVWTLSVSEAHLGDTHTPVAHTTWLILEAFESTRGQPDWEVAMWGNNPGEQWWDRERSWSGGAVLVGMGWDVVGQGSAINSRQGGVFTDSWKALGCRTGTCQMQLLLRLIDRVCIPPWWEDWSHQPVSRGIMSISKEKKKTKKKKERNTVKM